MLPTQDSAFTFWSPIVAEYAVTLGENFSKQVAEQCLSLVINPHAPARRQAFFSLFAGVLATVAQQERTILLQTYFALCKHADQNVRTSAVSILSQLKGLVDEHDFKLRLNSLVRDVCDLKPADIPAYRPVLDSALEHTRLFDEYAWSDLAALSKRLMQEPDASLQSYGLVLVSRMPKVPSEHENDIAHLVINAARTGPAPDKEAASKLLERLLSSGLAEKTRRSVEQFFSELQASKS